MREEDEAREPIFVKQHGIETNGLEKAIPSTNPLKKRTATSEIILKKKRTFDLFLISAGGRWPPEPLVFSWGAFHPRTAVLSI